MKRKTKLFIINKGILIDKLVPYRKVSKDLYLIKLDDDNRSLIDHYNQIQNDKLYNEMPYLKWWYVDRIIVDKYGKFCGYKFSKEVGYSYPIKHYIECYEKFKKEIDFETYKSKQLMEYVAYKNKIGKYEEEEE